LVTKGGGKEGRAKERESRGKKEGTKGRKETGTCGQVGERAHGQGNLQENKKTKDPPMMCKEKRCLKQKRGEREVIVLILLQDDTKKIGH